MTAAGDGGGILAAVRALEIAARRNVSSIYEGNYLTSLRGSGLEFHEARRYLPGDPVRHIDWNMTARLGEPFVRTFLEEREREIFVAVDVSASMFAGWQERSKLQTAIEVAATLGLSAVEAGDRLGLLTFDDRVHDFHRPLGGRRQLYTLLRVLVEAERRGPRRTQVSDPRAAIHAIQGLRGRRFVVFLVSDFIDHDVPDDLRYVRRRHDVSLIHIYDPLEHATHGPLRLLATAPEGAATTGLVDLERAEPLDEMQRFLESSAASLGMLVLSLSTREPVGTSLTRFFRRKQQWLR
jgi:uncharacterized protein (DUF58 family)